MTGDDVSYGKERHDHQFFSFKEKFQLQEVEKKIKAWADLKFFNDDMLAYLAFIRQRTDSLGCGIQRDSDPTLHQLMRFGMQKNNQTKLVKHSLVFLWKNKKRFISILELWVANYAKNRSRKF